MAKVAVWKDKKQCGDIFETGVFLLFFICQKIFFIVILEISKAYIFKDVRQYLHALPNVELMHRSRKSLLKL
jgi:hypothetical protein